MLNDQAIVYVVDDDDEMRRSLEWLFISAGLAVRTFETAEAFLQHGSLSRPACMVIDLRMPGMSGLDLQARLDTPVPVIIVTGFGEVASAVRAMKQGAIDFIEKPFSRQVLLDRVRAAIDQDRQALDESGERTELSTRVAQLTPREQEILNLVLVGLSSKEIATNLNISRKTVEIHRTHIMQKMQASNLAHLVRMATQYEFLR
jgi:RNA polymerase sigma factor (sigma-70 family)